MRVINMIDDFKVLIDQVNQVGKWEAFKSYYYKYPEIWEKICGYLYMINLEGLEPTVEHIDFMELLKKVEANQNKIDYIQQTAKSVARELEFSQDFELYIGVGLGHINGTALPGNKPMIYIGIECIDEQIVELEYLIAHEISHMVRSYKIKEINPNAFKERIITEGIGTLYPLLRAGEEVNKQTIAKVLFMPEEKVQVLLDNEEELTRKIFEKMEFELNSQLMKRYFMYDGSSEEAQLAGYFIGMRVIERILKTGKSIQKITAMCADDIISKYQDTL